MIPNSKELRDVCARPLCTILHKALLDNRYQPRGLVRKRRQSLIDFQMILNLFMCEGFAYVRTELPGTFISEHLI